MKLRLLFSFLSWKRKDNDNRLFFFLLFKECRVTSILFLVSDMLQSFIVLQCYESLFESMTTQMSPGSAPTQQKNLVSGKNQECFCALAVCKTLRDFPDDTG